MSVRNVGALALALAVLAADAAHNQSRYRTITIEARRFWYWCRKLKNEAASAAPTHALAFVPVEVTAPSNGPLIDVVLRTGKRLQLQDGGCPASPRAGPRTRRRLCRACRIPER